MAPHCSAPEHRPCPKIAQRIHEQITCAAHGSRPTEGLFRLVPTYRKRSCTHIHRSAPEMHVYMTTHAHVSVHYKMKACVCFYMQLNIPTRMNTYIFAYMHTQGKNVCVHTCVHTCIYTYEYPPRHQDKYACINTCIDTQTNTHIHAHIPMRIHTHTHITYPHRRMHADMHAFIHAYIHTHTHPAQTQTYRYTHIHTYLCTYNNRYSHADAHVDEHALAAGFGFSCPSPPPFFRGCGEVGLLEIHLDALFVLTMLVDLVFVPPALFG